MVSLIVMLGFSAINGWAAPAAKSAPMHDPNIGYDHSPANIVTVTVEGGVKRPGQYRLSASNSAWDAIEAAGSFSPLALKEQITLRRVIDGHTHIFALSWPHRPRSHSPCCSGPTSRAAR